MECKIEGEFRRSVMKGFGPFRRQHWEIEPFSCIVIAEAGRVNPVEGLSLGCVQTPNGWVVEGTIKGVGCYFAEFLKNETRTSASFTMITIMDIDVRGKIDVIGGSAALVRTQPQTQSRPHGFAA